MKEMTHQNILVSNIALYKHVSRKLNDSLVTIPTKFTVILDFSCEAKQPSRAQ